VTSEAKPARNPTCEATDPFEVESLDPDPDEESSE